MSVEPIESAAPATRLRVAVIGGGAAGLAATWSLDRAHDVVLFEREDVLGGHIRTLGRNVACGALPEGVHLDAGVVEFDLGHFPTFAAFVRALGVPTEASPDLGATCLYRADGRVLRSPSARRASGEGALERGLEWARLLPSVLRRRRFLRRAAALDADALASAAVGRLLEPSVDGSASDFDVWIRALLMYAYSMSFEDVASLSASVAVPMLTSFLGQNEWVRIPGGVYTYVERLRTGLAADVRVGARIRQVLRRPDDVVLVHEDGAHEVFDAVVIAVPPHRVLSLLAAPSPLERAFFGAFQGGEVVTTVHTDTQPYTRRDATIFTEFDLFEQHDGHFGYNAYLNRLAGLPTDRPPHYSLAFELEREIDPACVLYRAHHDVAYYTADALRRRGELERAQGANRTQYAGAYLGDGLHEGAIRSGLSAGLRLRGRHVGPRAEDGDGAPLSEGVDRP